MKTVNPYLQQYKKNQVETATPEQVLILLYDGAIQYLNRAKVALNEANNEQFHSNILGCQKIIMEFMNTLDMEHGGTLAQNLYRLYDYFYNVLVKVGINREVAGIDEVLKHLTGLRETWQKAIEISNSEKRANLMDSDEGRHDSQQIQDKYVKNDEDEYEYEDDEDDEDDEDELEEVS